MIKPARIAITVALAGVFQSAQGEVSALAGQPPAPQDCWVEHTQVQPSPARDGSADKPVKATAYAALKEQHIGAEHPTAEQKKPCDLKVPRAAPDTGVTMPRSLAQ